MSRWGFASLAAGVLFLAPWAAAQKPHATPTAGEVAAEGVMVKRSEITKKNPDADLGVVRFWVVEKTKDVQCLFAEVSGTIPMHFHPDGVHRMYVIEGKIRMTIGKETMDMEAGDFMMIPRGVRHKVQRLGEGKAYFATVDTPPIDPKKITWIEPVPPK